MLRHLKSPRQTLICSPGSNRSPLTKNVLQTTTTCTKTFSVRAALRSIRTSETLEGATTIQWMSCEWLTTTRKTLRIMCMKIIEETMSFSKSTMKTLSNSSGYSRNYPYSKKKHHYKLRQRLTSNNEPDSSLISLRRPWAQPNTQMILTTKASHQTMVSQLRSIHRTMMQKRQMKRI